MCDNALDFHEEYLIDSLNTTPHSTLSHKQCQTIEGIATLTHLESNCAVVAPAPSPYAGKHPQLNMDQWRALLAFMASALPRSHPDFDAVLTNPEAFVDAIHMTPETHLVDEHASIAMALANALQQLEMSRHESHGFRCHVRMELSNSSSSTG